MTPSPLPAALAALALLAAGSIALQLVLHRRQRRRFRRVMRAFAAQQDALVRELHQQRAFAGLLTALQPRAPLPRLADWAISPDLAQLLVETVLDVRPRVVLECGSGASTVLVAYALERAGGGEVIAIEHDARTAEHTRQALRRHGLEGRARVVEAPLQNLTLGEHVFRWYDVGALAALPTAELLFVDGPPGHVARLGRYPAVPLLWKRLAPTAVVILDDAARADERTIAERWSTEFSELELEFHATEKGAAVLRRRPATA